VSVVIRGVGREEQTEGKPEEGKVEDRIDEINMQ